MKGQASNTLREALAVQVLEEVNDVVEKVETLKSEIGAASRVFAANTVELNEAADRFRLVVTAFTEQAKSELTDHQDRAMKLAMARSTEELHQAMRVAAKSAFDAQSWDTAGTLASRLTAAASEFRRATWSRMLENAAVALVAGVLASALTYGLVNNG